MATSSRVDVVFGAQWSELTAGVQEVAKQIEGLTAPIAGVVEGFANIGTAIVAGLAIHEITDFISSVVSLGASLERLSVSTGLPVETLSALRLAASENNIEFDGLARALQRFSANVANANTPTSKQTFALQALGLTTKDLIATGGDLGKQLELVGGRFAQLTGDTAKQNIASDLFGQRLRGMVPLLQDIGVNGMEGLRRHADELGVTIGGEFAHRAEEAEKKLKDFSAQVEALKVALTIGLLPAITAVVAALGKLFTDLTPPTTAQAQIALLTQSIKKLNEELEQGQKRWFTTPTDTSRDNAIRARIAQLEEAKNAILDQERELNSAKGLSSVSENKAKDPEELAAEQRLAKAKAEARIAEARAAYSQERGLAQENFQLGLATTEQERQAFINAENSKFQAEQTFFAQRRALAHGDAAELAKIDGEQAAARIQHEAAINQIEAQASTQREARARSDLTEQLKALDDEKTAAERTAEFKYKTDQTSLEARTRALVAAVNRWEQSETDALSEMQRRYADDVDKWREYENRKTDITRKAEEERRQIGINASEQNLRQFQSIFGGIQSAFGSSITGMITRTQTFQQAMQNVATSVIDTFVNRMIKLIVENWLLGEEEQTAATVTGSATRTAARTTSAAAGEAAEATAAGGSILTSAGRGAAAVYADVAEIPYVGWLLAPAAAAAAFAAIAAFGGKIGTAAQGAVLGQDQLVMAHAQEMILPADISTGLQGMIASGDGAGASGGTVTVAPVVHFNISAIDGASVQRWFVQNKGTIATSVASAAQYSHSDLMKLIPR